MESFSQPKKRPVEDYVSMFDVLDSQAVCMVVENLETDEEIVRQLEELTHSCKPEALTELKEIFPDIGYETLDTLFALFGDDGDKIAQFLLREVDPEDWEEEDLFDDPQPARRNRRGVPLEVEFGSGPKFFEKAPVPENAWLQGSEQIKESLASHGYTTEYSSYIPHSAYSESLPPSRMHEMSARSHQGYRHELEFSETDEVRENTGDKQAEWVRVGARENPKSSGSQKNNLLEGMRRLPPEELRKLESNLKTYLTKHGMRNCELSNMLSQAARSNLFEQNNSKSREMRKLDLHQLYVEEALEELEKFLRDVAPRDPNEVVTAEIVVGVGNHSKGGRPKIKPRVIEVLELYNIGYRELNPGSLEVCLKRRKLKGGSFY